MRTSNSQSFGAAKPVMSNLYKCTLENRLPLSKRDTAELAEYFLTFMTAKGFQLHDFAYENGFEQTWQSNGSYQQLSYWWKLATFRLPTRFSYFVRDPQVYALDATTEHASLARINSPHSLIDTRSRQYEAVAC